MSEMVERVARAIWERQNPEEPWRSSHCEVRLSHDAAIAAIEAMRQPTEAMLRAGSDQLDCAREQHCWQAMIDEALK